MKMSGRVTRCCLALFLVLTSVSAAHKKLKSIRDLKKIDFGTSVPKHSLILLHWFANAVNIDNNNFIRLTFNPNSDYGSHHYGNYERLLDPLPRGYWYYTVGNLYQDTSIQFPVYVIDPPMEYERENMDRIIIRVQGQRTDQVYIAQHYDTSEYQGTPYDPDHTYQITVNLLRQIREFSVRDGQRPLVHLRNRFGSNADDGYIKHTWGSLACLGLFLFIVIDEKYLLNKRNNRPKNNRVENNYRPGNNSPANINRVENNYRPENNRLEIYNSLENNNRQKNYYHCALAIFFCLFILFFVLNVLSALFLHTTEESLQPLP
ncbi:uncharacterized protein LOC115575517 [Sparus aurata]|uniref:Uncharacterized LOC115575517 n=1 Tax=Sparus aurata TaxID=8175 RepID=A0A671XB10_SPAAU|nr:uncharacterized protein LOC115575517 [Sparus aurata]